MLYAERPVNQLQGSNIDWFLRAAIAYHLSYKWLEKMNHSKTESKMPKRYYNDISEHSCNSFWQLMCVCVLDCFYFDYISVRLSVYLSMYVVPYDSIAKNTSLFLEHGENYYYTNGTRLLQKVDGGRWRTKHFYDLLTEKPSAYAQTILISLHAYKY